MDKGSVKLGVQVVDGEEVEVRDSCFHEVEEYIEMNLNKPDMLSLPTMSAAFNYSPSQFSRRFKAVANKSVKEYIIDMKMEKAKEMLRTVNVSITDIAYDLGYTNPFYFTNVFTKQNGLSPTEYRSKFSGMRR